MIEGLLGAGLGALTAYVAHRGKLGWRWTTLPRSIALGLGVALFGITIARFIIVGVTTEGPVPFVAVWGLALVVTVALGRSVRSRWPTVGPVLLVLTLLSLVIPGLGKQMSAVATPLVIVAMLLVLMHGVMRGRPR